MKVLDLFSGIGGFALGLQRAGFTTSYFCEIDPYCRRVLAKHWPNVPCFEDVRTLHGADLGPIDLICGGFPCQDISTAGKGAGLSGARSGLWSEYARIIQEIKPKYVLIENVAALRSRGLDQVLREIAALGYDAEWHCIPASAVGAPHRRDRVWIVAYAQGQRINGDQRVVCTQEWRPRSALSREFEQPSNVSDPQSKRTQGGIFQPRGSSQSREDGLAQSLADPHSQRKLQPQGSQLDERGWISNSGEDVADRQQQRPQGWLHRWEDQEQQGEQGYLGRCSSVDRQPIENWWAVEPTMGELVNGVSGGLVRFNGRVATKIPNRVNKLKGLGNAVVPQIVEVLGRMIMRYEAERHGPL